MRSVGDRIRHAVSFEAIGLALITPLGAWAFGMPMHDIGVVGVVSATIATVWNFVYNLLFDMALQRMAGAARKKGLIRIYHAILFEVGLLALLMPFIAWYLRITLWAALVMDISFALRRQG